MFQIRGCARLWQTALAALLLIAIASVSRASESIVLAAAAGDWQAFESDQSCSIGIGSESTFSLFYFRARDSFALDVTSPIPWRFAGGAGPAIRLSADGNPALSRDDGALKFNVVQFLLSSEDTSRLLKKMQGSRMLNIMFPNSNRDGGYISLDGARSVIDAFLRCVADERGPAGSNDYPQGSLLPARAWSAASLAAADAFEEATAQIQRLNDFVRSNHNVMVGWEFMADVVELQSQMGPLSECIEHNCNDLPPSNIEAFRNAVATFASAMTAKGIPPLSEKRTLYEP